MSRIPLFAMGPEIFHVRFEMLSAIFVNIGFIGLGSRAGISSPYWAGLLVGVKGYGIGLQQGEIELEDVWPARLMSSRESIQRSW